MITRMCWGSVRENPGAARAETSSPGCSYDPTGSPPGVRGASKQPRAARAETSNPRCIYDPTGSRPRARGARGIRGGGSPVRLVERKQNPRGSLLNSDRYLALRDAHLEWGTGPGGCVVSTPRNPAAISLGNSSTTAPEACGMLVGCLWAAS